jgi:alcohol dehydrogenase (cytochrome c)
MIAGVTTTEGDLIFSGELTGDLLALDARTGKVLLRSPLDRPAAGGVVTYNARGVGKWRKRSIFRFVSGGKTKYLR